MRRRLAKILLLCALAASSVALVACGEEEEEHHAVEGEPLELGELLYNVQITRFLNPSNLDDRVYLEGADRAPAGREYLAVFMRIHNEGSEPQRIPSAFSLHNSRGVTFQPVELENPFALQLGQVIEPGGEVPEPDTPAAAGPVKGSMVLFLVEGAATENRPLELEIPRPGGEVGRIELDL